MEQILILDGLKMRSDMFQPQITECFQSANIQICNTDHLFIPLIHIFSGDILLYFSSGIHADSILILEAVQHRKLGDRCILVTNKVSGWVVSHLKTLGLYGYLVMEENGNKILVEAIKAVSEGHPYYCQKVSQAITGAFRVKSEFDLSEREKQIALLISQDLSSKQIADELYLSTYTVSSYRKNILRKLKVKSTGGLIRKLADSGFF